jgi:hypothetical protein
MGIIFAVPFSKDPSCYFIFGKLRKLEDEANNFFSFYIMQSYWRKPVGGIVFCGKQESKGTVLHE